MFGEAADILVQARREAGLSIRALANTTGVSPSTIARIEAGRMDPTTGMLHRILAGAGKELIIDARSRQPGQDKSSRLADFADAWKPSKVGDQPDFTRLRALLDEVALEPQRVASVIVDVPAPSGSAVMDTLLAAIAEKLADDAGLTRPAWTAKVPDLRETWASPATPSMRKTAEAATPPQLALRGFILDETSLWRDWASVGV